MPEVAIITVVGTIHRAMEGTIAGVWAQAIVAGIIRIPSTAIIMAAIADLSRLMIRKFILISVICGAAACSKPSQTAVKKQEIAPQVSRFSGTAQDRGRAVILALSEAFLKCEKSGRSLYRAQKEGGALGIATVRSVDDTCSNLTGGVSEDDITATFEGDAQEQFLMAHTICTNAIADRVAIARSMTARMLGTPKEDATPTPSMIEASDASCASSLVDAGATVDIKPDFVTTALHKGD